MTDCSEKVFKIHQMTVQHRMKPFSGKMSSVTSIEIMRYHSRCNYTTSSLKKFLPKDLMRSLL